MAPILVAIARPGLAISYERCIALKESALERMVQKLAADRISRRRDGQVARCRLAISLIAEHRLNLVGEPIQSAILQSGACADQINVKSRGREWQLICSKAKYIREPRSEAAR